MTNVTNIDDLMLHLGEDMTAKELGAVVIALVPKKLKFKLACEARHRLGKDWTDSTIRQWTAPSNHREQRAEQQRMLNREAGKDWQKKNRERANAKSKRWRAENWSRHLHNTRGWREMNRDRCLSVRKQWRAQNAERLRTRYREYYEERLATDSLFRLKHHLRVRLRNALHGRSKSARTMELVGCSIEELRAHLEQQFINNMTWENYGQWHVDHRVPCAAWDLSDPEQQRACFHWSNLQPMWGTENSSKGSLHNGVRHRHGSRSGAQVEAPRPDA